MIATFIRHTAVDVPEGMVYGQTDVGLKISFPEELKVIQDKIRNQLFDAIYCSPLTRCKLLAASLFPDHNISYDERIKEMHFGDWEGEFWKDLEQNEAANHWFKNWQTEKCPGGESNTEMAQRVILFYHEILQKHSNQEVAVVCHGGPIMSILAHIEKTDMNAQFEKRIGYGEVFRIEGNKVSRL